MPEEIAPNVLSWASELDELTRAQAEVTARLPILAGHLALMPDAHLGKGATIGSVAEQVGYGTPFAFSTAFKRIRGVSPQQYRTAADQAVAA